MTKNAVLKNKISFLSKKSVTKTYFALASPCGEAVTQVTDEAKNKKRKTLYNFKGIWYNSTVKKLLAITTALCAAACGLALGNYGVARADGEVLDSYPDNFTKTAAFGDLKDYAVSGGKYAFLDGGAVKEYDGSSLTAVDTGGKEVSSVRYSGENLVYKAGEEYFDAAGEKVDYADGVKTDEITKNGWFYSYNSNSVIVAYNADVGEKLLGESYELLREYGEKVYAVSENVLYELNGGESTPLSFEYLDFGAVGNIGAANAAQAVKEANASAPQFVTVAENAFMTEIDLDGSNETFSVKETARAAAGVSALLLGKVGNDGGVAMIMVGGETEGKCYILRSQDTAVSERAALEEKSLGATVTVAEGFVYSAPFVCAKTQIKAIKSGDKLNVKGEIKKEICPELVRDFYKVSWTDDDGTEQTGYVPFGYVSLFTISEEPPAVTPDPDYSQENSIRPVVLILLVVVLVLAAVGYLVFVGTANKTKKIKAKKDDKTQNE